MGFLHFLKARTEIQNRSTPSTGVSSMAVERESGGREVVQDLIPIPRLEHRER